MKKHLRNILIFLFVSTILTLSGGPLESKTTPQEIPADTTTKSPADTVKIDTTGVLPYNFEDEPEFAYPNQNDSLKLYLRNPSNIKTDIEYNPVTGEYDFIEKVGNLEFRLPKTMTKKQFEKYDFEQSIQNYWRSQTHIKSLEEKGGLIPRLTVGGKAFNKIFGSNTIDIRPQGYVEVSFGYQVNNTQNPSIPERLRKVPTFDFNQKIQMNVLGKIGDRMDMRVNYNTEATFDYENKMNLAYTGDDDQIVKKIEAGNVSLPLNGSLITGGTNLFGVKTELQFGKLDVTTIFSQNKGETKVIDSQGGAQKKTFEISASDYDANRHFFLAQYFRDHYNQALKNLPIIRSNITINKIEVWVTNKSSSTTGNRNILAFMDLGEPDSIYNKVGAFQKTPGLQYPESIYPFNGANGLYKQITENYSNIRQVDQINKTLSPLAVSNFMGGQDYEKIEQARLLSSSEYTVNVNLGYISLKSALNSDEVLAVAYNYTTSDGKTYQVGEFSTDGVSAPQTLVLKLLKGTNLSPKIPTWKLMMKNVYDLNAYQLSKDQFVLDVLYQNDQTGTDQNYLPEGRLNGHILLHVLNLDNLNSQQDLGSDGVFDYVEGVTVNSSSGKIIFPVVEPFGKYLADSIGDPSLAQKYAYQTLYDSTKTVAEQDAEHNKFKLKGSYQGASSNEIMVGSTNLARGSVKVTSGGRTLTENVDYTVDYASGIVKIINSGLLESGTPIQVSTESQDLFSMQRKTMLGAHANYAFSDKFNLGATVLHMQERPLTQKVGYGEDPISNTMVGLDATYSTQSQFLTTLIDKLPFYSTKTPSSLSFEGEYAHLIPGHSHVISKSGTVYIDDFEATKTSIDLKSRTDWVLASTPQHQSMFPEAATNDDLAYGFNRAKLAWYIIDPILQRSTSTTPGNLKNSDAQLDPLVREVYEKDIFPDRQTPVGQPTNIPTFDLAFYPNDRGPYNFDTNPSPYSQGVNPDGTLRDPGSRWGGIMRSVQPSDFEAANIENIEFWMMDPFVDDSLDQNPGGDLYFNLGDISEDILKDSRKSFENGLPTTSQVTKVDTTVWGRVSTRQSVTQEFDNNAASRKYQDVGLDGLDDADETTFRQGYLDALKGILTQKAWDKLAKDPDGDDFHYYRGSDYDQENLGILARYKNFNGTEGNSPIAGNSNLSYTPSASTRPDMEDINHDNTLNEYERYYQYKISIRKKDMVLGKNDITDIRTAHVKMKDGTIREVKWYQFKVPVKNPDASFGNIADFKSIRFMRMFMRGFADSTILRFATLDLVRADWRKYTKDVDGNIGIVSPNTQFDISAVSIEENASRKPVNYVLPPGVNRVIDPANPQLRQLNEQAMSLKVIDLQQGDARAVYKTLAMDFRNYKRIKMDVHAEAVDGYPLKDGDLSLIMRIGSDYTYNYYEYEVPLSLTPEGVYNSNNEADRYAVWPDSNRIDLSLDAFTNLKLLRNQAMHQATPTASLTQVYTEMDGNRKIKIKGNPNLGNVQVMMIGIRYNKKDANNYGPKSAEVWVNELALSNLDESGGWAATGRVTARLADLGSVVVAGTHHSVGFGSIDKKVNERAMEDQTNVDVAANLDLGKFFPDKAQVKIPMYIGYSQGKSNPKYNPVDPDITMKQALSMASSKSERDSIKQLAQDVVTRKSINLTNIKINKTSKSGKPKIYDPANFSLTYSYNETNIRNVNTAENLDKNYRGMFSYNFNSRPKAFEPFSKSKFLRAKPLRLIKDFNLYLMPSQISFRTDLWRHYNETQLRNLSNPNMIIPMTFNKDFIWNRYFDMRYNLTRTLEIDFSNQNTARIDEPPGRINRHDDDYKWKRDSILTNLLNLGRPTLYHHTINASYRVPVNKLPLLDWTSLSARYQAMYDWQTGPITDTSVVLGNVIQNSRQVQLNGQLNMVSLYNKVKFLKDINQKYGTSTRQQTRMQRSRSGGRQQPQQTRNKPEKEQPKFKEVQYTVKNVRLKAHTPKSIFHKLKTEKVEVTATGKDGKKIPGKVSVINANRITFTSEKNATGVKFVVKGKVQVNHDLGKKILEYSARALMSVRNISINYSTTDGTVLPGFMPEPHFLGMGKYTPNQNLNGELPSQTRAPGIPFILGWQDKNFGINAANKGWLTTDSTLNSPYVMTRSENWSFRANVEPFPDLRIDVNANRIYSERTSEFLTYNNAQWNPVNKSVSGNFSMSINTMKTAFSKMSGDSIPVSKAYLNMLAYRSRIANRLAAQRAQAVPGYVPRDPGTNQEYPTGYSATSPQVLIPAFLAAYTGQSPDKVTLDPFPSLKFIRPNWRITYEGMVSKIDWLKKYMKTLSFSHAYRSSYNVGSFISNLDYNAGLVGGGYSSAVNAAGNFVAPSDINSVSITEQFAPLINIDITWINDFETRAEIKSSRNLALSFANNQLTEVLSNEMAFGIGYRFQHMDLIIKTKKSQKAYSNDLNIRADLSFTKNQTIIRKLVELENERTAGQNNVTLKTTADYQLSDRFQLRLYYDHILNKPLVGSFNTSNSDFGVSFRFTLAQ